MRNLLIGAAVVLGCIVFAVPLFEKEDRAPAPQRVLPGSDRDAHGCIPSAGYLWCERSRQCERPWELAAKEHFGNTQQAFDEYCGNREEKKAAVNPDR